MKFIIIILLTFTIIVTSLLLIVMSFANVNVCPILNVVRKIWCKVMTLVYDYDRTNGYSVNVITLMGFFSSKIVTKVCNVLSMSDNSGRILSMS